MEPTHFIRTDDEYGRMLDACNLYNCTDEEAREELERENGRFKGRQRTSYLYRREHGGLTLLTTKKQKR